MKAKPYGFMVIAAPPDRSPACLVGPHLGERRGLGLRRAWSGRLPCHGGAGDVTLLCDPRGSLVTWKPTADAGGEERPGPGLACQPSRAAPLWSDWLPLDRWGGFSFAWSWALWASFSKSAQERRRWAVVFLFFLDVLAGAVVFLCVY